MLLVRNRMLRMAAGVIETANLLTLKLLIKQPGAVRMFPNRIFRAYHDLAKFDRWRCADWNELFPEASGKRITLEPQAGRGIITSLEELAAMAVVTRALEPGIIFEIGTFRGRTALNFAINSPPHCEVHTLDLPPESRDEAMQRTNSADAALISVSAPGVEFQGREEAKKIRQHFCDSTKFDYSPWYDRADIVFVDGGHDYYTASRDTQAALRMVRPGGCVLWHDVGFYGAYNDVTRAVLDALPGKELVQIQATSLAMYRKPA